MTKAPSRWWGLGILIPLALFVSVGRFVSEGYLTRMYFAGDPCRWVVAARAMTPPVATAEACADLGPAATAATAISTEILDDARAALLLDLAFAASFAVVGYLVLRAGHRHWAPARRRGDRGIWRHMAVIAVVAGVLDLVESTGQLIWLESTDPPTVVTHLVAVVAWWKWAAYLVAIGGLCGLVVGPALAPIVRPAMRALLSATDEALGVTPAPTRRDDDIAAEVDGEVLGICASGGGIRSASVMLGAFRGLAAAGTFQRARWLHAVSGGGFTAGGWRASSLARDEVDLFDADDAWFASVRARRRYLDNGVGSIVGGVLGVLVRTTVVFGCVVWSAIGVGWIAGRFTRSWFVVPGFSNDESGATALPDLLSWRLLLPGLIPLAVALAVFVASRTVADVARRATPNSIVAVSAALGAALTLLLVVIPIGIRYGRPVLSLLRMGSAEANAGILGVLSAIGLVTAVQKLLTAQIKKRWSRLGGVFLLLGMFVLAGKVADDQANAGGVFSAGWFPMAALAWLVVADIVPSHRLTLNGVYRKRLSETFLLGRGDRVPLEPLAYETEPLWAEYRNAPGPELVLCGTAHSSTLREGGLPALGFTFRPAGVTLHDGASAQWIGYPGGSSWEGFPRRWIVSRSMALAGAAFASAMGRQSFGTTNSLLAAVNLRLGMWVPNPKHADWFVDRHRSPRVHLGYFAKELFNRYDPNDDAFVYVADGGHRDNLGLVEQLRERPDRIIILDASGDRPGGFGTMRQAIQLADSELGVQIDLDFARIEPREHDVGIDCVTTGTATFRSGDADNDDVDGSTAPHVVKLVYAKSQVSDTMPADLRQFAASMPPFPDYSTGDQYLTEVEFDMLVAAGEHLAARIQSLLAET